MDRDRFFDEIRVSLFHGRLSPSQADGINAKLNAFDKFSISDDRWKAYMLATSYHETAKTMQPVEEYGKGRGKGKPYGKKIKYSGESYTWPDKIYYGRGDVQLTWYENYEKMGKLLGIHLLENPDLALDPSISAHIMIEGMTTSISLEGDFTGLSLENFFNSYTDDPINARRIINGLDKAKLIAGYHLKFLDAIKKAKNEIS